MAFLTSKGMRLQATKTSRKSASIDAKLSPLESLYCSASAALEVC